VVNTYLGLTLARYEIAATEQYMAFLRSLKAQRLFALFVHKSLKDLI